MKKIIIACMALLLAGCSHMQTYTSDQMMDRSDEQINDQGPMQETRSHMLAVNEMGGSSTSLSQVCDKNGQPMIDLYFDIPENGHIDTVLSYEIVPESDVETLDGLFMVSVDDQVVPSSVEGGKMAEVHYVQLPVKGSLSEIDVDVSQIDLRYNHSIDFSFVYKSSAKDQMQNIHTVSKFIGRQDNASYLDYFDTLLYPGTADDSFLQEAIDLFDANDEAFLSSEAWSTIYQPVINGTGGLFVPEAIASIADPQKMGDHSDTRFSGPAGGELDLRVLYKYMDDDQARTGMFMVWCDGKWARFDQGETLLYDIDAQTAVSGDCTLELPEEPGDYDIFLLNMKLNDPEGYVPEYVSCYTVEVR